MKKELSEAAKEARRQYGRAWRAKNREKCAEYDRTRWERLAEKMVNENAENENH